MVKIQFVKNYINEDYMIKKITNLMIMAVSICVSVNSFGVTIQPNQTIEIPIKNEGNIVCQLKNHQEFESYLMLNAKAGNFEQISYNTCVYSGGAMLCAGASGSKILLGADNETIHIYGVSKSNLAYRVTSFSGQNVDVNCQ